MLDSKINKSVKHEEKKQTSDKKYVGEIKNETGRWAVEIRQKNIFQEGRSRLGKSKRYGLSKIEESCEKNLVSVAIDDLNTIIG